MQNKTAIVWSQPKCSYCDMAKTMLVARGYQVEERVIGVTHTKEQFFEAMPKERSVPQVILDGVFIPRGYVGLKEHFSAQV